MHVSPHSRAPESKRDERISPCCRAGGIDESQVQGAFCWMAGTLVLGRKPLCHLLTAKSQGFSATHEQDSARGLAPLVPLSWGQGAFGPTRGLSCEERGLRQVVGSQQEGRGRNCDTSQYQSYFSKGKHFIVQFYATILYGGHLSQRTLSRLLVPGDLKLQPGQGWCQGDFEQQPAWARSASLMIKCCFWRHFQE